MRITPIAALQDNYIWLLDNGSHALCIDPGQAEPVLDFVRQHRLQLDSIWLTHFHHDHIDGVAELAQQFSQVAIYGASDVQAALSPLSIHTVGEGSCVKWHNITAQVWHTAGHTEQHLSYLLDVSGSLHVFCGDTLFAAGCGRAFTQRPDWLYHSLQRFNTLPENTLFYPAHEYTASNLRFAVHLEPDNAQIQAALIAAYNTPTLPTTLMHERQINPFLRVHLPSIRQQAEHFSGSTLNDEMAVFTALRAWKNVF
ncbi:MAG: hydroxyacylglutathione hydrolase [Alysiella sp.]|uniref:hydroxyacylglutathione hydrolase n=1 Tax=Alysiella sp. TaxID=1872483 RepID=UPI0026DBA1BC|nr:hydroxyacylglutathione hydrolase [Alysiella sp.]MDO4434355.1 hydroxyacylglutathione hydrolase [Alysiella sp.]